MFLHEIASQHTKLNAGYLLRIKREAVFMLLCYERIEREDTFFSVLMYHSKLSPSLFPILLGAGKLRGIQ